MTVSLRKRGVKVVLLDIEGTTTPIAFVYEVLFPYARTHLRTYLRAHANDVKDVADLLRVEHKSRVDNGESVPLWSEATAEELLRSIEHFCEWLMDGDVKSPGLKLLQGKIWQQGYDDGSLRGDVFPDVPPAFERWTKAGFRLAIYSSGSVQAQQLIFRHTNVGDLTRFLSAYFDTAVGEKKSWSSYRHIAASLGVSGTEVLFLSDAEAELEAASEAGMRVALAVRPGNQPATDSGFERVTSFDQVPV